ncbi:hypothetical protein C5S31_04095 [ANME-1 cluster archaeon GoMg2]|nr:hypothetical protein [ANME-1 cluster archaeon GoMg2]
MTKIKWYVEGLNTSYKKGKRGMKEKLSPTTWDAPEFIRGGTAGAYIMVKLYKGKIIVELITMKRKIVEGITVKRVRPEGCIHKQCSDIKR